MCALSPILEWQTDDDGHWCVNVGTVGAMKNDADFLIRLSIHLLTEYTTYLVFYDLDFHDMQSWRKVTTLKGSILVIVWRLHAPALVANTLRVPLV